MGRGRATSEEFLCAGKMFRGAEVKDAPERRSVEGNLAPVVADMRDEELES